MPVGVEFTDPRWLLLLPVVAALLVLARLPYLRAGPTHGGGPVGRSGAPSHRAGRLPRWPLAGAGEVRGPELRRLALRLGWSALLVLALAGLTITRPLNRQATVFVLDASASVAPVRDAVEAAAREAARALPGGDRVGVVAVAGGVAVEERPTDDPAFRSLAAALPTGASDLADGLRLAGALLPEGYTGRVVLVSDGRQTSGDAVATARELAARGVTVDVLPVGAAASDVRLEAVALPETAYRGEAPVLTVRVYADAPLAATLRVVRDDGLLLERSVELRRGRQEIALPLPAAEPGLHRYRVDVSPADPAADATPLNNALGAVQRVIGPPRVLLVGGNPGASGYLPAAFEAGGAEVVVSAPSGLPADLVGWARYDAVVLADVPANALPAGSMDLIERYVRDLGRGLVMTGGPDSFGPGGYAETPVERTLPVYMDLRGRGRQPRVALLLILDKSGSMEGTKMELAKEAAARSVRVLRPGDQAAVLAFDSVPQWVIGWTPATEGERLEGAIGSIYAGGGTEIYPAAAAGVAALRDVEADVKHIILMTDGQSGSGGDYGELLRQARDARITVSTVAVGADADTALLQAMARAGRGRYHFAADPASVPQIFTQETLQATRSILIDERFYPAAAAASPILRGIAAVPPLEGYVAATPKERAEVVLVSPESDPILAAWQYGLGRAVAWTPDLGGRWSGAWAGSPSAAALWDNVLSWLLPPTEGGELSVRLDQAGSDAVAITAENRSDWETVRPTRAVLLGPDGRRREVALQPAGPGRYAAHVEGIEPGTYVVQVEQRVEGDAGGNVRRAEVGWAAPYPAEYRDAGIDAALLARIAEAGGGRVLAAGAEAVEPATRPTVARWPAWPLLLVLAALGWPLEIAARRLPLGELAAGLWRLVRGQTGRAVPSGRPLSVPAAAIGGLPARGPAGAAWLGELAAHRLQRRAAATELGDAAAPAGSAATISVEAAPPRPDRYGSLRAQLAVALSPRNGDESTGDADAADLHPAAAVPAGSTARRLLERKRTLRERQGRIE